MQKPGFIWKIYGLYFTLLTAQHFLSLLIPQSRIYLFYHLLIGFDRRLITVYAYTILGSAFSVAALWPLYLFIFHKKRFTPRICRGPDGQLLSISHSKIFLLHRPDAGLPNLSR